MLSLVERAPIYAWLAQLFVREIDEAVWQTLREIEIATIFDRIEPGFSAWIATPWTDGRKQELDEEFARLFLVPRGTSPFASAWIPGDREKLGGELATLVTRSFEALDREPVRADPWGRLPLDHVAVLFDLVAQAIASGGPIDLEVAARLDRDALGDWLVPFGHALAGQARSPVYRAMGGFVAALHESVDEDPTSAEI